MPRLRAGEPAYRFPALTVPTTAELQPELFIELGRALAEEKGINTLDRVRISTPRATISFAVTNEGTNPGRAKCQLTAQAENGQRLRTANTISEQIPGGETAEQTERIPGLEEEPASVSIW